MEEEEFNENSENEEEEKKVDKLEVIMEENNYSENYFSTNKKSIQDKNKSISSSKYNSNKNNSKLNQNESNKEKNENNMEKNEYNIVKNFQNNIEFNNNAENDIKDNKYKEDKINSENGKDNNKFNIKENNNEVNEKSNNNSDELVNQFNKNVEKIYTDQKDINENQDLNSYNLMNNDDINNNIELEQKNDDDFIIEENKISDNENNKNNNEKEGYFSYNQFINDSNKKSQYKEKDIQGSENSIKNNNITNSIINSNKVENNEDENIMELYSYEGNENNNNYNDNVNEEYFINQNIIAFQNKNKVKQQENNNNENILLNEEEKDKIRNDKYFTEVSQKNDNLEEIKFSNEKRRSGVIQLNNFKVNKNNNNIAVNNEEEISNEHKNKLTISLNQKENKEKELSAQKGAMKLLQLLISKKQEKEEKEKIKEENLIENFKRARASQKIEYENVQNKENEIIEKENIDKNNLLNKEREKNEKDVIINKENKIKIKEDIKPQKNEKNDNENKINLNKNRIIKGKIYIKNSKKMPYRKLKINNIQLNNSNEKIESKSKEKNYKDISNKKHLYNINFNTNPSSTNKNKDYKSNQHKKSLTPFNKQSDNENQISLQNKRKVNNKNKKEDDLMILNNKSLNPIERSYDMVTAYKQRNIKNQYLTESPPSPPSPVIYSYKRPINSRRNSYSKFNSIQPNNYDIKEVIKKKRMKNMYKSTLLNNFSKGIPVSNDKSYRNNYNNINNSNYNNKYNSINTNLMNNSSYIKKKKYLFSSKTSNNFKNIINKNKFLNHNEIDLSSDNINYNQYKSNRNYNNIYQNYLNNNYDEKTFYKRNDYYNSIENDQLNQQKSNKINQSLPLSNKRNLRQKILKTNYYNSNDNYIDNNIINNYNIYNNNYISYNDYNNQDSYYINNNINKENKKKFSISINIEDLMVLEEKLSDILYFLKTKKEVKNQCYDFWNYFYNSSLYKRIEKTFKEEKDIEIIRISINYELLSIMLCYEFSFDKKILNKTYILLLEILELNHRNLIIICENILNKIGQENKRNEWVLKLYEMVKNSRKDEEKFRQDITYSEKINYNIEKLSKKLRSILLNYKTEYSPLIMSLLKKISQKNYEEINDFFREYILRIDNPKKFNLGIDNNSEYESARPPYILSPREKPYTLVLGLDETLINFQQINYTQGVLKLRPFLIEFLENVSQYYELILFTSQTQYYSEPIIKAIEQKKKYFDFIFYRENCLIIGNDYVKDLTRIGRPLDSTIIIDNMPQYFRFQKENGINIKSFWAQSQNDRALYDLIPILINIAEEEIDVREGLEKYREEIVRKITSNISKNYI